MRYRIESIVLRVAKLNGKSRRHLSPKPLFAGGKGLVKGLNIMSKMTDLRVESRN